MPILRPFIRPAMRHHFLASRMHRTFVSTPAYCIKETADRSPGELERKKQEQLKKQEKGQGEWHEELASEGESNIAADKQEVKDHEEHMEELQKDTARKGEQGKI